MEILNLIVRMRSLHSGMCSSVTSWNDNLRWHDCKSETIIHFSLISKNICIFQLKIALIEKNA